MTTSTFSLYKGDDRVTLTSYIQGDTDELSMEPRAALFHSSPSARRSLSHSHFCRMA